jgi:hypothetical protein
MGAPTLYDNCHCLPHDGSTHRCTAAAVLWIPRRSAVVGYADLQGITLGRAAHRRLLRAHPLAIVWRSRDDVPAKPTRDRPLRPRCATGAALFLLYVITLAPYRHGTRWYITAAYTFGLPPGNPLFVPWAGSSR